VTSGGLLPYSISSDGKWLVARPTPAPDLLLLATGTDRLTPLIQTQFSEVNAEISSDGRWLAYQSHLRATRDLRSARLPM
jgi:hypothetical protein